MVDTTQPAASFKATNPNLCSSLLNNIVALATLHTHKFLFSSLLQPANTEGQQQRHVNHGVLKGGDFFSRTLSPVKFAHIVLFCLVVFILPVLWINRLLYTYSPEAWFAKNNFALKSALGNQNFQK